MALFGKRRGQAEADQAEGPRTLLDETSPYGSRRVLVATNGTETWAQLFDGSGQQVTALWLAAHRGPAPDVPLSVPPEATRSPGGRPQLGRVEAVWFEEGDGVALFDSEGMLAVLPGWAGPDTLPGYAREAVSPSPSAAPLQGAVEQFGPRAERARAYWDWRNRPTSWQEYQAELQNHVASRLGPPQGVWPLGNGVPPVLAQRHGTGAEHIALTIGMSGQRMPTVEQHTGDPGPQSRIELAVAGLGENNADLLLLNWLARYPWRAASWLGSRHFVRWPGDGFPLGAPFAGVLLVDEPSLLAGPPAPDLSGHDVFGDRVRFLWLVPITEDEMGTARTEGADALLARLRAAGRSWVAGEAGKEPAAANAAHDAEEADEAAETDENVGAAEDASRGTDTGEDDEPSTAEASAASTAEAEPDDAADATAGWPDRPDATDPRD
ncbi:MAG TPA: suppressor of fused domain protein [Streptosporangiales bacterium]